MCLLGQLFLFIAVVYIILYATIFMDQERELESSVRVLFDLCSAIDHILE